MSFQRTPAYSLSILLRFALLPTMALVLAFLSGCATTRQSASLDDPASAESNALSELPELADFDINAFKEVREERSRMDLAKMIIETAKSQLGVMYRYGGNSPETGFDCAGFSSWVFAQHGIKLPRSSGQQLNIGIPISKEELKPGDLIIYTRRLGSRTSTHATIYIGDGKMIHSPRTGRPVAINDAFDAYHTARYIGARRVILDADEAKVYAQRVQERKKVLAQSTVHKVKSGDTLLALAQRYGVSVSAIMQANNIARASVLHIGQKLLIPGTGGTGTAGGVATADAGTTASAPKNWDRTYVVKSGDSVWSIARRHNVSESAMLAANNLQKRHTLSIGQKLKVPGSDPVTESPATKPVETAAAPPAPEQKQAESAQPQKQSQTQAAAASAQKQAEPAQSVRMPGPQAGVHVVKSGDTVWSIAKRYNVSEKAMLDANNLTKKDVLRIGQKLVIPGASPVTAPVAVASRAQPQTPVAASSGTTLRNAEYKVRPGDTIWALARKHGLSEQELLAANNLSKSDVLSLGQTLLIPSAAE